MTSTVTILLDRQNQREAARATHPSIRAKLPTLALPTIDRAAGLIALARTWEDLHTRLSTGPDSLSDDAAHELLQHFASALVHPSAVPGLVFALPQLLAAVRQYDQVRDGEIHPTDATSDCLTIEQALTDLSDEIDWHLFPLLTGQPATEACRTCRLTAASVNQWQTQQGCAKHGRAL